MENLVDRDEGLERLDFVGEDRLPGLSVSIVLKTPLDPFGLVGRVGRLLAPDERSLVYKPSICAGLGGVGVAGNRG